MLLARTDPGNDAVGSWRDCASLLAGATFVRKAYVREA